MIFGKFQTSSGTEIPSFFHIGFSLYLESFFFFFNVILNLGNEFNVIHQYMLHFLSICRDYKKCIAQKNESGLQEAYILVVPQDVYT